MMTSTTTPQRLSAPAPGTDPDDDASDQAAAAAFEASDAHIDELCNSWAAWSRTRRYFGPPPLSAGTLGKLTKRGPGRRSAGGPNAHCSAELAALNAAVAAQPYSTARRVFELHYLHSVAHIKEAAAALGISRAHWYRLLHQFRREVYAAHHRILAANLAAGDALPHIASQQQHPAP